MCDAFVPPIAMRVPNTATRRKKDNLYNNSVGDGGRLNHNPITSHHEHVYHLYLSYIQSSLHNTLLYSSKKNSSSSTTTSVTTTKSKKAKTKIRSKIKDNKSKSSPSSSKPKTSSRKRKSRRSWTSSTTSITGKWKEFYILLQRFKSQQGHTRVPYNYRPNPQLGRWVARQRMLYRNLQEQEEEDNNEDEGIGDENSNNTQRPATALTPERVEALQSINFSFESPRTHTWALRFDELCIYKSIHGDCLVPLKYDPFPGLGVWVRNQRTLYRNFLQMGKISKSLSKEKISALQSIGFVWDTQRNDLWKKRFDELMDFKAVYGHCLVPEHYHENPQLGIWVVNQRTAYKNFLAGLVNGNGHGHGNGNNAHDNSTNSDSNNASGSSTMKRNSGNGLTKEKIIALETIGFCWAQTTYNWYSMFERLKQCKIEKKQQYILDQAQDSTGISNGIGGDDNDGSDNSDEKEVEDINELNLPEFFQIPPEDVSNRDLRLWIAVQRKEYSNYLRNSAMNQDNTFNSNIQNSNSNSNSIVSTPSTNQNIIKSCMTPRRIRALESIGFPWNISKNFKSSKNANNSEGPTVDDWSKLFEQMREKGIDSNMRPKEHWFEGQSLFKNDETDDEFVKKDLNKEWTDEDLLALWNMEADDDF